MCLILVNFKQIHTNGVLKDGYVELEVGWGDITLAHLYYILFTTLVSAAYKWCYTSYKHTQMALSLKTSVLPHGLGWRDDVPDH